MSETTNEDRMYPIEMTLQGARCCISIGKGVIKALGKPSHVSIKISDSRDSLSIFPCDEDDVMAFRVPLKLFTDHRCVMRINSKQFVHGIILSSGEIGGFPVLSKGSIPHPSGKEKRNL